MKTKTISYILIGGVLATVLVYNVLIIVLPWPITVFSISASGTFGDSFGLLTSLFSGLAFAGLIIAILMQKEELSLQREELELTRKELIGQKEELKIQNSTMKLQEFENTFFQMLSFHTEILKSIDIERGGKTHSGRDAFQELYRQLVNTNSSNLLKATSASDVNAVYKQFFSSAHNEIGHYLRRLYSIIKFIDQTDVIDKRFYTNLVRGQISSYELAILFYNCLSDVGNEKFKPLIEKYTLLKALPKSLIHQFKDLESCFEANAYSNT